jgi:Uri superfamily endonuclease
VTDQPDLPALPGVYALFVPLARPTVLQAGHLGLVTLPSGYYVYLGSAHGPGGLRARISRHLRPEKPLHWHIDYLTALAPVLNVWQSVNNAHGECIWTQRLLALPGATCPAPGFGSSDCREGCPSHLVRLPDHYDPEEAWKVLLNE